MKIKQCHPGCSWHIFNSARSLFKAKPEQAIAVFPKAALCLCLCFSCRRAVMGFWLPRVAWLKSGCQSRGKRHGLQGESLAGAGARWAREPAQPQERWWQTRSLSVARCQWICRVLSAKNYPWVPPCRGRGEQPARRTDAHLDSFNACTARMTSATGCQIAQFERFSRRVPFCFCSSCIANT